MSRLAKILWLVSGLSLALLVTARYILGGWTTDLLFVPLGLFAASCLVALVVDYKFYLEFFTLKTTRHGMNMGVLILLFIVMLVSINFFGKRYSKMWDFTEEKLHTLSEQTIGILQSLKDEVQVLVFYRGAKDAQAKQQVKQSLAMYEERSPQLKVRYVDAYVENEMAEQYLKGLAEANQAVIFIEYQGKKLRVESPFDEQNITSALIKATRSGVKTVYFLTGHGERPLTSEEADGLSILKQALEDASFVVKELNLFESKEIPADASIVAIVGPTLQIMDGEREAIKNYALRGGRLLIAADPGEKHQIALLTKTLGVEYRNNYILDIGLNQMLGRGIAGILGVDFDETSDITKKFIGRRGFTIFDKVSEVVADPGVSADIKVKEIIRSAPSSFAVNELKNVKRPNQQQPYSIAAVAEGRLSKDPTKPDSEKGDEFAAVIFGDSDFLAGKDVVNGFNIDLALNAIAFLAKEADLISIKPKAPTGTKMVLSSVQANTLVVGGIAIPFLFIILSGVMWYRRRNA